MPFDGESAPGLSRGSRIATVPFDGESVPGLSRGSRIVTVPFDGESVPGLSRGSRIATATETAHLVSFQHEGLVFLSYHHDWLGLSSREQLP